MALIFFRHVPEHFFCAPPHSAPLGRIRGGTHRATYSASRSDKTSAGERSQKTSGKSQSSYGNTIFPKPFVNGHTEIPMLDS